MFALEVEEKTISSFEEDFSFLHFEACVAVEYLNFVSLVFAKKNLA